MEEQRKGGGTGEESRRSSGGKGQWLEGSMGGVQGRRLRRALSCGETQTLQRRRLV